MFCSNCGEKLEDGTKFCPKCGAPVNGTVQLQTPEQPQVIGSNDTITQNISEDQETVIYQLDAMYWDGYTTIDSHMAFGPMIITDKRIIMQPKLADGNGGESGLNEMEVFWKDISNVKYSALSGTTLSFHFVTKKGKEKEKLHLTPWSGRVESIGGAPVAAIGKVAKGLYETIYSAWIKGR